ncbi:MAG: membrane protein insertase YidC, partial [Phycisphaerales bacterium]|nr:membrane protein insertase YidC [Phycisphaerales bacterium]
QATTQPAAPTASKPADTVTSAAPNQKLKWFVSKSPTSGQKATIGSLDARTGYVFQLEVLNRNASVRTLKLSDYFTSVGDKYAFNKDPDAYMAKINQPGQSDGHYTLLNHVEYDNTQHLPLASELYIKAEGEETASKVNIKNRWRMGAAKTAKDGLSQSISFQCTVYGGVTFADAKANPVVIKLTKTYTVTKNDYTVAIRLQAENLSDKKLTVRLDQKGPTGVPMESHRSDERYAVWGQLDEENEISPEVELKTKLEKEKKGVRKVLGTTAGKKEERPIVWVGQGNKFFVSLFYLKPEVADRIQAANYNAEVYCQGENETTESLTHITGIDIPAWTLAPKATKTLEFDLFAGPKLRAMFSDADDKLYKAQYEKLNYLGAINLRSCFCTFDLLTFGMMWLLNIFASVAGGNYGIAIFILVILVRIALHPLSKKGQVSMAKSQKAMKKLQPSIAKLKEKYANDRATLQKETMLLYKTQGANPMAGMVGCLPMMLQMPILIALWTGLNAAVELRHTGLLPIWITDLAAPDALFPLGFTIPVLDVSTLNLLPLLLGAAMFMQTKLNPAMATASTPEQETQQKMMKYMMPIMMVFFFYSAPSGLSLYFLTSTAFGILEATIIRKHIAEQEAAEAAATTTVKVGGRGFRDSREKKPKSPYRKQ